MGASESLFPQERAEEATDEGEALASPAAWASTLSRIQLSEDVLLEAKVPESFDFVLDERLPEAKRLLADERITDMRYNLVPSELSEAEFWKRLFYTLSTADAKSPTRPSGEYEDFDAATPRCSSTPLATCTSFSLNATDRPTAAGNDFTPRGTALGAYDDFVATPPPRR